MDGVELACFPFDIQILPVRVKAKAWTFEGRSKRPRYSFTDGMKRRQLEEKYQQAKPNFKGDGHFALPTADGMQEFDIYGICGYPKLEISTKFDVYEVALAVKRPLGILFDDIKITNAMVWVACLSFYDIASADLSARLSISLTIMLTLASYMSDRPPAIQNLPTRTIHDKNEVLQWLLLIMITVLNLASVMLCGAESMAESGANEAPLHMIRYYWEHKEDLCAKGYLATRCSTRSRCLQCWASRCVGGSTATVGSCGTATRAVANSPGCGMLPGQATAPSAPSSSGRRWSTTKTTPLTGFSREGARWRTWRDRAASTPAAPPRAAEAREGGFITTSERRSITT